MIKKVHLHQKPYKWVILLCALGWAFLFRRFLTGELYFVHDAIPYYQHTKFFLDSLAKGVFPLMDPFRDFGSINEFYLRRIGEFNPVYLIILLLNKVGISFPISYRIFLAGYFFLGAFGFYKLCRLLFRDPAAWSAAVALFILSSLGTLPFYNYLLLLLVPWVWLMFFAAVFIRTFERKYMLGVVFCVMILNITYIPAYTAICAASGAMLMLIFYSKSVISVAGAFRRFWALNTLFCMICVVLVLLSFVPGALWFLQSSHSETVVPYRFSGTGSTNSAVVNLTLVNRGGAIGPMLYDQAFFDLDRRRLGEFFVPLFAFLVLAAGSAVRINRRMLFLVAWGAFLYLISIADGAGVYEFLYKHVFFMQFFRNAEYFLWIGVMPILFLFIGEVLERMREDTERWPAAFLWFIVAIHGAAVLFFAAQEGPVMVSNYIAVTASLCFFLCLLGSAGVMRDRIAPVLLFVAMAVQPVEVYSYLEKKYVPKTGQDQYERNYDYFHFPSTDQWPMIEAKEWDIAFGAPYYSTWRLHGLFYNLSYSVLYEYLKTRLLLYDGLEPVDEDKINKSKIEQKFGNLENKAFISFADAPGLMLSNGRIGQDHPQIITAQSKEMRLLKFTANELILQSSLQQPKFMVYNNAYHSNWRAYIDGQPVRILRTNMAFMGFWLPAGEHRIALVFERPWRYVQCWAFMGLYVLTLGVLLWMFFRRQSK